MYKLTPPEARAKLVAALRSGEFLQSSGSLTRIERSCDTEEPESVSHCCLGVACEMMLREEGPDALVVGEHQSGRFYDNESGVLPEHTREWLGFTTRNGRFTTAGMPHREVVPGFLPDASLIYLNDTLRMPFAQIADVIEAEPTGLCV